MALPKTPATIGYALFETAFGVCGVAWSARGVVRLVLPEASIEETETRLCRQAKVDARMKPPAWIADAIGAVQGYFLGEQVDLSTVALDLAHEPEFERRVYDALRRVGWAATTTYGRLASDAGSPGAARAVGRAMARNPVPVIVPCHRVLAAGGAVGGFSAHGGIATKQRMLALERVTLAI
jgi:methylated-DNA-[protein]-cysteine S-methyltransferase